MRRYLRDVAALTALPALWSRCDPRQVAEGLADVMAKMLSPTLTYVWLNGLAGRDTVEAVRTGQGPDPPGRASAVGQALEPWLTTDTPDTALLALPRERSSLLTCEASFAGRAWAHPLADGLLQATVSPIGYGREFGVLVVASDQHAFPTEEDRLLVGIAANQAALVLQRRQAEAVQRRHNERLRLLWEAAAVLLSTDSPDAMLRSLFAKIGAHLGLDSYFNFMVDEAGDALRLASCAGIPEEAVRSISRLEFGQAICGTVALCRRPVVASFIQQSDDPKAQLVKSFGIRVYACNPLLAGDRLLGTLSFASRSRDDFHAEELEFLETISHYVTYAYERLRLIGRLQEADRRKNEFLATLAHELRNPLAPIRNGLQLLALAGDNRATREQARTMMERQVRQMVRLIDDLLDLSRITRNRLELRTERVELAAVVQSAVEASRPLIESFSHELTVTLPAEPVYLNADLHRLAQVLSNLLNNAAKYTNRGGRIALTAWLEGGAVVLSVKDNGIGIPAEHLPRLFEMFSQVDSALERSQGGLGIGLSLVKGLIGMHGGSVEAMSDGPGTGSTFIVRLPVLVGSPASSRNGEQPPTGAGGPARGSAGCRILVVDDNRDSAESLALLLRLAGHEIQAAHDGLEAVEAAGWFRPDVVLLDIGLPKLNGYEAARRIREEPWGREMVLVALTGWGQDEDKHRAQEAGFDHHLTKPVDPTALQSLLTDLPVGRRALACEEKTIGRG
jgi:signal transduction histidine kinase/ActR/RegA family two-component response regulator